MLKRLAISLAVMLCAAIFLFPFTAYAEEEVEAATVNEIETAGQEAEQETDPDTIVDDDIGEDADVEATAESEDTESGIPPYDDLKHLTPDGAGTVIDNVFIEGNGLEFLTFTSEDGNVFYLVIDRSRADGNVYFLNTVTEQDLLSLAEKGETSGGGAGTSASGIPAAPGAADTEPEPTEKPEEPEQPPAKGGGNTGMIIFLVIGAVVFGAVAYYIKIVRPKQQAAEDDDGDDGYDDGYGYGDDDEDDYLGGTEDATDPDDGERSQ